MLAQETVRLVATPAEVSAIGSLMAEPEAVVSGAPLPSPEAGGLLLLQLLLSPKEPREPKGK